MGATLVVLVVFVLAHVSWVNLPDQLFFDLLPLPAAVDWLAQTLWRSESTTLRRIFTGALLGVAWANLLVVLVLKPWPWGVMGLLALACYVVVIMFFIARSGKVKEILEEHFPGVTG